MSLTNLDNKSCHLADSRLPGSFHYFNWKINYDLTRAAPHVLNFNRGTRLPEREIVVVLNFSLRRK